MSIDASSISTFVEVLSNSGPYGIAGVLAWVVYRKDQTLKSTNEKIVEMTEAQTAAITRVEGILTAMNVSINEIKETLRTQL